MPQPARLPRRGVAPLLRQGVPALQALRQGVGWVPHAVVLPPLWGVPQAPQRGVALLLQQGVPEVAQALRRGAYEVVLVPQQGA